MINTVLWMTLQTWQVDIKKIAKKIVLLFEADISPRLLVWTWALQLPRRRVPCLWEILKPQMCLYTHLLGLERSYSSVGMRPSHPLICCSSCQEKKSSLPEMLSACLRADGQPGRPMTYNFQGGDLEDMPRQCPSLNFWKCKVNSLQWGHHSWV